MPMSLSSTITHSPVRVTAIEEKMAANKIA